MLIRYAYGVQRRGYAEEWRITERLGVEEPVTAKVCFISLFRFQGRATNGTRRSRNPCPHYMF